MIGDVLTSTILFEVLKKHFPTANLHYLINSHTKAVVEGHPHIDQLVLFTPEMEASNIGLFRMMKKVKKAQYDVVIDVYGKLSSKLITKFSGAKMRIAYEKSSNGLFYSHSIDRITKPEHNSSLAIENRLRLLQPLGIDFEVVEPKIYLTEDEVDNAAAYLKESGIDSNKPLYMISVLGSSEAKTYPANNMAQLLDEIVDEKPEAQLLFNYIPKQEVDAREIYDFSSVVTQQRIYFDVFGNSLREFLAITKHCDALIGNEGGAVNMAKALNIPTFIIFSPHLNKKNWFGESETQRSTAVHLSDFVTISEEERMQAKTNFKPFYLKFKPTFIAPLLRDFLRTL